MLRIHIPMRLAVPAVLACLLLIGRVAAQEEAPRPNTPENACAPHELTTVADTTVFTVPGDAVLYEAGMAIDADGAPNAYHPNDDDGLDDLANAGEPGHWWAIATDEDGEPLVQGPEDPAPGFYVSMTALWDRTKGPRDPHRYVDATVIPYVSIPSGLPQVRVGDFAVVRNGHTSQMAYAIVADVGPREKIGEGSIALAQALGIRSSARRGGARDGIAYLIFSNSGDRRPHSLDEINSAAHDQFESWGGAARLTACQEQLQRSQASPGQDAHSTSN